MPKKRSKLGSYFLNKTQILGMLRELFLPDEIVEDLEYIDIDDLLLKGYNTVILDLDNTLLGIKEKNIPLEHIHWIQKLKTLGFDVYVFSNNSDKRRVERMCKQINVEGTYFSMKPLPFSLKEFGKIKGIDLKKSVYIGDQILTDVFVGNWVKAYAVLIQSDRYPLTVIKRLQKDVEKSLLQLIAPKNI